MGQKFFEDKIGTLSESGGVITLGESYLTLGGQQFHVDSLTFDLSTITPLQSAQLYYLYARLSGGVPEMIANLSFTPSQFVSNFPTGKIVGAFYTDGLGSPSFASFVNIDGPAETNFIDYIPGGTWSTNTVYSGQFKRSGDSFIFKMNMNISGGAPDAVTLGIDPVTGAGITSAANPANTFSVEARDSGVREFVFSAYQTTLTNYNIVHSEAGNSGIVNHVNPFNWGTSADRILISGILRADQWSNTPIKDL